MNKIKVVNDNLELSNVSKNIQVEYYKKECLFEDYIDKKYVITDVLNDEIEIIEEEKEIQKYLQHIEKQIITMISIYTFIDDDEIYFEEEEDE